MADHHTQDPTCVSSAVPNEVKTSADAIPAQKKSKQKNGHYKLKGAEGPLEVQGGDYYFNTKVRAKAMMVLKSLSIKARQVYACLELGTMGFNQELAVVMINGKKVPMTPGYIAKQTGLTKQHVRRALEELEAAGLVERRSDDGGPLRHGHVRLYSWAVPRSRPESAGSSRVRLLYPAWLKDEKLAALRPLVSRFKLQLIDDPEVLAACREKLEVAARAYFEAQEVALRELESICAGERIYKDERKERQRRKKGERGPAPVGASSVVEEERVPEPVPPPKAQPSTIEPPSTALVQHRPPDNHQEHQILYDQWRVIMDGCGKPVSLHSDRQCRKLFYSYPLSVAERIVEDAGIRAEGPWNTPAWTPDPLEYLRSRIWDLKPIKRRSFARAPTQNEQGFLNVLAMADEYDKKRNGGS